MIFLRLSAGFLLQVIPFAVLALYPYCEQLRFSKKRSILLTLWLLLGLSALFAGCGCYLRFLLPPDHTLFQAVNVVFLLCILPCLGWYLYLVPGVWQKSCSSFPSPSPAGWSSTPSTMPSAPCSSRLCSMTGCPITGGNWSFWPS